MKFAKILLKTMPLSLLALFVFFVFASELKAEASLPIKNRSHLISQSLPAAPTFNHGNGVYLTPVSLTMTAASGTKIYYTLDGSQPTVNSLPYYQGTGGISVSSITQVNAIAIDGSGNQSATSTVYICMDPTTTNIYVNSSTNNDLLVWLRSDIGVADSSSSVNLWADLSGTANDASQTISAHQPTNVDDVVNGYSAVNFGASGQFLQFPSGFSDFSQGATFIAVVKPSVLASGSVILDLGNGSASDNLGMKESSTAGGLQSFVYNGSTASGVTAVNALSAGQFQVISSVYDGINTATIFTNGVQQAQSTAMSTSNNLARAANFLCQAGGGGDYFQGQICELFIYKKALSLSQRSIAEAYLLGKYQILNQVPATPVISVPSGTLPGPTQVAIANEGGSQVFWTNDGSTPTATSNLYAQPLNVYYSQTIKAVAIKDGVTSPMSTATFTLDPTLWPAPSSGGPDLQLNITLPRTSIPQ